MRMCVIRARRRQRSVLPADRGQGVPNGEGWVARRLEGECKIGAGILMPTVGAIEARMLFPEARRTGGRTLRARARKSLAAERTEMDKYQRRLEADLKVAERVHRSMIPASRREGDPRNFVRVHTDDRRGRRLRRRSTSRATDAVSWGSATSWATGWPRRCWPLASIASC